METNFVIQNFHAIKTKKLLSLSVTYVNFQFLTLTNDNLKFCNDDCYLQNTPCVFLMNIIRIICDHQGERFMSNIS